MIIENNNKSTTKFDKAKTRNFNDFTLLSTKEKDSNFLAYDKSPVLLVKKESNKKEVTYRYPNRIQVG